MNAKAIIIYLDHENNDLCTEEFPSKEKAREWMQRNNDGIGYKCVLATPAYKDGELSVESEIDT